MVVNKDRSAQDSRARKTTVSAFGERRFPPLRITDAGKVRLGGQGPVFRPTADTGKVRLGGQGPAFRKAAIADVGKVRLGGQGPVFP